ncbi:hypothetical protein H4R34_001197 [Dimargaris verticillata]|uniref:Succinate dehydrogenase cytochrome b560 subunit n=1 Tax=Dimargaris verticillata TaxID=2761393 RepID=A0A9W8EB58_9FUNG|nr:hypothetical protein H4R34_001197 [Dimargaris verticillata]
MARANPTLGVRAFSSTAKFRQATVDDSMSQPEIAKRARENRPVSPHLSIYQPQLTWYLSSATRITGAALAAVLLGAPITSASVIAAVSALPVTAKVAAKFLIAVPFTFHSFNGIRHLIWDTGRALTLKGVYNTGYAVLAATLVTSGYLATM